MATKGEVAYGRRLLSKALDELSVVELNGVYAVIPKMSDIKDGHRDISSSIPVLIARVGQVGGSSQATTGV
ncbi:hypothetical protein SUNI508_04084 [Seiridium unicorne]|uniref:Uncharacterized protein n=1 Tax=Seiridium unicorne TaxID=138068 RepID=A0ABR2V9L2_9PEZI